MIKKYCDRFSITRTEAIRKAINNLLSDDLKKTVSDCVVAALTAKNTLQAEL